MTIGIKRSGGGAGKGKDAARTRRHLRVRKKVAGTPERPRLVVTRSTRHMVAQLVDDAMVRVEREGEDDLRIAVDGGFLSVTEESVTVLAESAEFESEIDESAAREASESDDPRIAARGRARLRAVGAID